jgi:hypothetical protein
MFQTVEYPEEDEKLRQRMSLPAWAILYLVIFVAIMVIAEAFPDEDSTPKWRRACDAVAYILLIIVFCSHWVNPKAPYAPLLAIVGLGWEIQSIPSGIERIRDDPELTGRERVAAIVAGTILGWPMYATAIAALIRPLL